jgi:hypothetical protein
VTHKEIKTLEDGTRVYACGHTYKPMADSERKNKRHKPDDPRAVRLGQRWYLPLDLLPDAERVLPETVEDLPLDQLSGKMRKKILRQRRAKQWPTSYRRGDSS